MPPRLRFVPVAWWIVSAPDRDVATGEAKKQARNWVPAVVAWQRRAIDGEETDMIKLRLATCALVFGLLAGPAMAADIAVAAYLEGGKR